MSCSHRYPNRIIPQKSYKEFIINKSLNDHFLIRYDTKGYPIPDKQTFDSIKKENFSTGYFKKGLSTSLVGVFSKSDARFVIRKESKEVLCQPWSPGSKPVRIKNKDFEYSINRGYFGLLVKDILSCSFNFDVMIDNKIDRTDKAFYEIHHEPTQCNYWHFSIYAYAINGNTNDKYFIREGTLSKRCAENAIRNIAAILMDYAKLSNEVERIVIPRRFYCEHAKKPRFYRAKRSK